MVSVLKDRSYTKHVVVCTLFLFCIITIWQSSLIDWDEGVFALQGQWFSSLGSQGKPYNFQTPPLFQLVIALFFAVIGHHWYVLPLVSVFFACGTLYIVHALTAAHYTKEEAFFAMLLTASTELFIFFTRSGLSDATFLFLFTGAAYFFLQGLRKDRIREFTIAGVIVAAAMYTKYSALPLLVSFVIIGLINRKSITCRWFFPSVILPLLLYLPYLSLFAYVVQISTIASRHGPLVGIHHLAYAHYGLLFAPVVLTLAVIHVVTCRERRGIAHIVIFAAVYFIFVGFYQPYMRLLLPIIPLCGILAARLVARTRRLRIAIMTVAVLGGLFLGHRTIVYVSDTPRLIAERTERACREQKCGLLYAAVPPNIAFYLPGEILVPEDHVWTSMGSRCPFLMRDRTIMMRTVNVLDTNTIPVYLHATIYDSLKQTHVRMFEGMSLAWTLEFIDAPLYRRDPYNPLKDYMQGYELYTITADGSIPVLNDLWQLGFEPPVTVLEQ